MEQNETLTYRRLELVDLTGTLLDRFNRYQETKRVWYKAPNNQYRMKADHFIEEWDAEKKAQVIQELKKCMESGGAVVGAFVGADLVGFANVEGQLFGSQQQYLELPYIHVSKEYRHQGIGKQLFTLCCDEAKKRNAQKLYIAAHPAEETQHFYQSVGCTYALEVNQEIYNREPLDLQLEIRL